MVKMYKMVNGVKCIRKIEKTEMGIMLVWDGITKVIMAGNEFSVSELVFGVGWLTRIEKQIAERHPSYAHFERSEMGW